MTSIHARKAQSESLTCLLCCVDLCLQQDGALVDGLKLREVRIEDANDLGDLPMKKKSPSASAGPENKEYFHLRARPPW